jgi:hypothetical protein
MIRGIEQRLRKLEAANDGPQRLRIVFSMTSDPADWDSQIAEMISSGQASPDDEFMQIGWVPDTAPLSDAQGPPGAARSVRRFQSGPVAGPLGVATRAGTSGTEHLWKRAIEAGATRIFGIEAGPIRQPHCPPYLSTRIRDCERQTKSQRSIPPPNQDRMFVQIPRRL